VRGGAGAEERDGGGARVVLVARGGGAATAPSSVLASAAPRVELGLGVWGNLWLMAIEEVVETTVRLPPQ
jgi:hypothetical protein